MYRQTTTAMICGLLLVVIAGGCGRRSAPPTPAAQPPPQAAQPRHTTPEPAPEPLDYPTVTAAIPVEETPAAIRSRPPQDARGCAFATDSAGNVQLIDLPHRPRHVGRLHDEDASSAMFLSAAWSLDGSMALLETDSGATARHLRLWDGSSIREPSEWDDAPPHRWPITWIGADTVMLGALGCERWVGRLNDPGIRNGGRSGIVRIAPVETFEATQTIGDAPETAYDAAFLSPDRTVLLFQDKEAFEFRSLESEVLGQFSVDYTGDWPSTRPVRWSEDSASATLQTSPQGYTRFSIRGEKLAEWRFPVGAIGGSGLTPDARRLAWIEDLTLWTTEPEPGRKRPATVEGLSARKYGWSPEELVWVAAGTYGGPARLYIYDPEAHSLTPVDKRYEFAHRTHSPQAKWSPDGGCLAIVCRRDAEPEREDVVVVDAVAGEGRNITMHEPPDADSKTRYPFLRLVGWTDDSRFVVYERVVPSSAAGDEAREWWIAAADGSARHKLIEFDEYGDLVWTPEVE